jgi:mevalonate kinase
MEVIVQQGTAIAQAPAKIIISGEHAVVYNQTAVACAIKKYTTVQVSANNLNALVLKEQILPFKALRDLYLLAKSNYQLYLSGQISINRIFKNPMHFLPMAIYEILELLNYDYSSGLTVIVNSDIPIGAGFGSSSALLAACINAVSAALHVNLSLSAKYTYTRNIENLQHGKSSGLDLYTCLTGGLLYKSGNLHRKLPMIDGRLYIVNTGQPRSTTGDCVAFVKDNFKDQRLVDEFKSIADFISESLEQHKTAALLPALAANQRLLEYINVVSARVGKFITELETSQTSAKVCGAGTIVGEENGIVLILTLEDDLTRILKIVREYGYQLETVEIDDDGSKIL